jgi:hypothetical protein
MARLLAFLLIISTAASADDLPDTASTPGATNPQVSQSTIHQTICIDHWTASVRSSSAYTNYIKRKLMAAYDLAEEPLSDFELDHLIPLTLGGHPTDERNLWPQPWFGACNASVKDKLEVHLNWLVCMGRLTLREAQTAIATDWVKAYNSYLAPLQCD